MHAVEKNNEGRDIIKIYPRVDGDFTPSQVEFFIPTSGALINDINVLFNLMEKSTPVIHNKTMGFKPDFVVLGREVCYPASDVVMSYLKGVHAFALLEDMKKLHL